MSTFATLERQNDLFGRISRALENTKKLGADKLNRFTLESRLRSLEKNWERFQSSRDKLIGALTDEIRESAYFSSDLYQDCKEAYHESRASILQLREPLTEPADDAVNASHLSTGSHSGMCRALPKISLPKFSGEYHDWPSFRDLFHFMIASNKGVSSVEKLHYLKAQVTGEASRYLANIPVTAENFSRAWEALTSRYENRRLLVSTYLDRFSSSNHSRKNRALNSRHFSLQ